MWQNGHCEFVVAPPLSFDLPFLLLGVAALGLGVAMRRKLRRDGLPPKPTGPDPRGRQSVQRIMTMALPYFLMLWGAVFFTGGALLVAGTLTG
ncbi:hypothetical protein ACFVTC_40200 [Streptomyces sp. NPDC057950]|uniref:hypothetical protein n=1 Tax=Streptomyces sp. NPDC057950 TaxID=3346288 RepID=UPI0036ED4730